MPLSATTPTLFSSFHWLHCFITRNLAQDAVQLTRDVRGVIRKEVTC